MSLQAIFDPMVRSYFKKKYAGGGDLPEGVYVFAAEDSKIYSFEGQ